jgi:hypothetical protein
MPIALLLALACSVSPTAAPTPDPATPAADCGGLDEEACATDPDCEPVHGYRCADGQAIYMACGPGEPMCSDTAIPRCADDASAVEAGTAGGCAYPNGDGNCPEGWTWVSPGGADCYPD